MTHLVSTDQFNGEEVEDSCERLEHLLENAQEEVAVANTDAVQLIRHLQNVLEDKDRVIENLADELGHFVNEMQWRRVEVPGEKGKVAIVFDGWSNGNDPLGDIERMLEGE